MFNVFAVSLLMGLGNLDVWHKPNSATAMQTQEVGQTSNANSSLSMSSSRYCESPSCRYFAESFLSNVDHELNPCDDFYEFICNKNIRSVDELSNLNIDQNIKSLVEGNERDTGYESENLVRLRNLYASCNNPNPRNLDYLRDLIEKLGGFPIGGRMSGWNDDVTFDWVKKTIEFRQLGLNLNQFFDFGTKIDDTHHRFKVDITKRDSLLDVVTIEEIIRYMYSDQEVAWIRSELFELRSFRKRLRQIIKSEAGEMQQYSFPEFELKYERVNWYELFSGLLNRQENFLDKPFIVKNDKKTSAIAWLLSLSEPEVLANHMIVSVIESFAHHLSLPRQSHFRLFVYPEKDCTLVLQERLGLSLSVEYFNRFMTPSIVAKTSEMIDNIKTEFKLLMDEADWIVNTATKQTAKAKIDTMKFDIGITEELLDPNTSELFYRGMKLSEENFIENVMAINRCKYDIYLDYWLNRQRDDLHWVNYDKHVNTEVQAFYHYPSHRVMIQAGILSRIYVDDSQLDSVNYGVLGASIAHEMMHSFDFQGIKRNENNIKCDWCDPHSNHRYILKAGCLRRQYDGLKLDGAEWQLNGVDTLRENIADNGSLEAAYRAFKRSLMSDVDIIKPNIMKGIPFDFAQLFWVSNAVSHCEDIKTKENVDFYRAEYHSPPKFRVNIPMINHVTFSKDFKCPHDSYMNPADRCIIW